ncbi:glycosyltransferase family 4 protein [Desulfonatronum thiodismutans]|uniref:glycosyltransferase family 4 protein n=1 Tax=Desulfonatronum thiodismutans TaxID=159290 RepID=UPI0013773154|nr:glycosyltransferase family 4 protein [Desulfonatronum thiodismutans]
MNILFYTRDIPYPITSGHHIRTFHYVNALLQNHHVVLAAYGDRKEEHAGILYFESSGCVVYLIGPRKNFNRCQRILSIFGTLLTTLPYAVKMREDTSTREALAELVKKEKFDLVICDGIHLAPNLPANIGCKTILDEHNIESMLVKRYALTVNNPIKKFAAFAEHRKFVRFERRTWDQFNEIHVCSEVDRDHVLQRVSKPAVRVVPNPVDTEKLQPLEITKKPFSLIYTGLMGWKPNVDAVIYFVNSIYPLIKHAVPEVNFTIVGKNPTPAVQKLGKKDRSISIIGYVEDISTYILEHSVFIVPLRIGSGTRLKILEAMALGKAIVSTTVGCEGLDVHHGKNILIADDPRDFSSAVVHLLLNHLLNDLLGKNGRLLVEGKYSVKIMKESLNNYVDTFSTS